MKCDPRVLDAIPPERLDAWVSYFIELITLRMGERGELNNYAGFAFHFKKLVDIIWGDRDYQHRFIWTPNANKMLEVVLMNKFTGIAGHASSGKGWFGVMWGLGNYLLDPENTKVFYTSTTLRDAEERIWGDVLRAWRHMEAFFGGIQELIPGKIVESRGYIRSIVNGVSTQLAGLSLIAGEKGSEKDSVKKIGFKAKKLIFICDEMPLLSHDLYEAAKGNLFSNPDFQFIGIGNPTSHLDPFGVFTEPEDGWNSIDEHSEGWKTKLGYTIRFDGLKSPNVLAGREIYKGLLTLEKLRDYERNLGPDSLEFWKMVRGFYSPTGRTDAVFWESDFETGHARRQVDDWEDVATPWASLDPSFAHGGDLAIGTFGLCGTVRDTAGVRRKVCEKTGDVDYNRLVDRAKNKTMEIVRLFAEDIRKRHIQTKHVVIDSTGGGDPFAGPLAAAIGDGFMMVKFNGRASELPVSKTDKRKGSERFYNKVTEIYYVLRDLMRGQHLAGIDAQVMVELCARDYESVGREQVRLEAKDDMKKRTNGKSPDYADSYALGVELCRHRLGLAATEKSAAPPKKSAVPSIAARLMPRKGLQPRAPRAELSYSGARGWGQR